jgi:hypothetical protein
MDETGMQNPIFNLVQSMQNQNQSSSPNMMNNSMNNMMGMNNQMGGGMMNPGMNMNMMNQMGTGMMNPNMMGMNNMGNSGMMNPGMNMNMMNQNMINNMGNSGMMNAAMNMNMMNMNNMNNLNNQGYNSPPQNNNGGINVFFRAGQNGENGSIMVQCTLEERVSEVIKRYGTKAMEDTNKKKFIFNAKALVPSLTVAEAGLQEGANIFVVNTAGVKGA